MTRITIIAILLLSLCGCTDISRKEIYDDDLPTLNLTKNALWDAPAKNECDVESFSKNVAMEMGVPYQQLMQHQEAGKATLQEMQTVYDSLATSKSPYAGYARIRILSSMLINTPMEQFTVEMITRSLNQAYEIASGDVPVSQSVFFNFWDNCMVGYSNLGAYDTIFHESQKLLEICSRQNIPMGLMFSYKALAGNLQDHSDYSTAIQEYEKAGDVARKMFPKLISKDWETPKAMQRNINQSDYILCYIDLIANQLYCCTKSENYEWIKQNESLLEKMIEGIHKTPSVHLFMLYNMAQYYDVIGNDTLFSKYMEKAGEYKPNTDLELATYIDKEAISWYSFTMAMHELKLNHPARALDYMNSIPQEWLTISDNEVYADIYCRLGRYEEAAQQLQQVVEHNKKDLNGRNRATLSSMSSMIENKKKDEQMMLMKIEQQNVKLLYTSIIIALAFILAAVLAYFLYRQKKLNRSLSVALKKAEAANEAKAVFLRNMTHEINTPINQIHGFAELMADRSATFSEEEIRGMCDIIYESSSHLHKVATHIVEVADKVSELGEAHNTESVLK